jgi:para-nitrobenzyl esterase
VTEIVARTRHGRVRGTQTPAGLRFLGIPYAAPPAGPGRFAAPAPHEPWDGIRDATRYGATALQPDRGVTIIPEPLVAGDNCLNLNVFTPALGGTGLPVLVWIHGGGFFGGCNASPWYVGSSFNRDGVVVVSVNYRLGAEGFLVLPDAPANRAVLDWIAALEWVQENIAAFGGDPRRVTIAGQSAGGMACATLLGAPAARDLFRAAACLSGSVPHGPGLERAGEIARSLADHLGLPLSREAFEQVGDAALLDGQQAMMAKRPSGQGDAGGKGGEGLAALTAALATPGLPFAPVVDGEVVTQPVFDAVAAPANKHVPVLAGVTANEFGMVLRDAGWVTRDLLAAALGTLTGRDAAQVDRYVSAQQGRTPAEIAGQAITDQTFRLPMHELLAAAPAGFGYEFRWAPEAGPFAGLSVHCLDVPFVFDLLSADGVAEVAGSAPPQALADALHGAVTSFVTDLTPGWARYEPDRRLTMTFGGAGGPAEAELTPDPLALERSLWAGRWPS